MEDGAEPGMGQESCQWFLSDLYAGGILVETLPQLPVPESLGSLTHAQRMLSLSPLAFKI